MKHGWHTEAEVKNIHTQGGGGGGGSRLQSFILTPIIILRLGKPMKVSSNTVSRMSPIPLRGVLALPG